MFENDETANAVLNCSKTRITALFVDFDQDTCVRRITDKTPELNEKDDLDIEDEWYYEDEDYGGGLRGKIQNLYQSSQINGVKAIPGFFIRVGFG